MSEYISLKETFQDQLRCPATGGRLFLDKGWLVPESGGRKYRISDSGIPLFAEELASEEAKVQQLHYDRIAHSYLRSLSAPHAASHSETLDTAFFETLDGAVLENVAEICCGRGEALKLLEDRLAQSTGVDISNVMLEASQATWKQVLLCAR